MIRQEQDQKLARARAIDALWVRSGLTAEVVCDRYGTLNARDFRKYRRGERAFGHGVLIRLLEALSPDPDLFDERRAVEEFNRELLIQQDVVTDVDWGTRAAGIFYAYERARFTVLRQGEPRSPLELIKQSPGADRSIDLMVKVPNEILLKEQVRLLREGAYDRWYVGSVPEKESQLISRYVQLRLVRLLLGKGSKLSPVTSIYDAGCAEGVQRFSILTNSYGFVDANFKYVGQDYFDCWSSRVQGKRMDFVHCALPEVQDQPGSYDLVACGHVLHFLKLNPIAILGSCLGFNTLLRPNGLLYITVPEKQEQPGMLDVLETCALEAGFEILETNRVRLEHDLSEQDAWRVTTFGYVIARKAVETQGELHRKAVGAGLYFGGLHENAKRYGVTADADIDSETRGLAADLSALMGEPNELLRDFCYAFSALHKAKRHWEICDFTDQARELIHEIHRILQSPRLNDDTLQEAVGAYFFLLVRWFAARSSNDPLHGALVIRRATLRQALLGDMDSVRVTIETPADDQIDRLLEHIGELARYYGINLREQFRIQLQKELKDS